MNNELSDTMSENVRNTYHGRNAYNVSRRSSKPCDPALAMITGTKMNKFH